MSSSRVKHDKPVCGATTTTFKTHPACLDRSPLQFYYLRLVPIRRAQELPSIRVPLDPATAAIEVCNRRLTHL